MYGVNCFLKENIFVSYINEEIAYNIVVSCIFNYLLTVFCKIKPVLQFYVLKLNNLNSLKSTQTTKLSWVL
jgi:hypothetical protein